MHSCSDPSRIYGPGFGEQYGAGAEALADCPDGPLCPECTGLWPGPVEGLPCLPGSEAACESALVARRWGSPTANFNDVGHGMLTLFQVATLEDWERHMAAGMAVRGVGIAPEPRSKPEMGLFYVVFVMLGSLFFFNLIVSVLVDRYMRLKETGSDSVFLTDSQEAWVNTLRSSLREKPQAQLERPWHPLRGSGAIPTPRTAIPAAMCRSQSSRVATWKSVSMPCPTSLKLAVGLPHRRATSADSHAASEPGRHGRPSTGPGHSPVHSGHRGPSGQSASAS